MENPNSILAVFIETTARRARVLIQAPATAIGTYGVIFASGAAFGAYVTWRLVHRSSGVSYL